MKSKFFTLTMLLTTTGLINAQKDSLVDKSVSTLQDQVKAKAWYENVQIRGYVQARYNRLFETNPELKCEQCDRSWGDNGAFFIRRARIIFFGQISPRVYFYIQPDFASSAGTTGHVAQLRDA